MANLDLRPLSLGEILDFSFSLYRQNFVLFIGISAIPQLLVLALNLAQTFLGASTRLQGSFGAAVATSLLIGILTAIVTLIAYLLRQGATVCAVADLYLGRPTSIVNSFRKVRNELGILLGVVLLNGLAIGAAMLLLIVPGIYWACRLIVAVPAAVLENLGPVASLERSSALTKGSAGRAFLILLLYLVLVVAVSALFSGPPEVALALARNNPAMVRMWTAVIQISTALGTVLVTPFFLIATSIFYFDLRVRKEAFDLQMMLDPNAAIGPATGSAPGILS